jgi:hypothetical protein
MPDPSGGARPSGGSPGVTEEPPAGQPPSVPGTGGGAPQGTGALLFRLTPASFREKGRPRDGLEAVLTLTKAAGQALGPRRFFALTDDGEALSLLASGRTAHARPWRGPKNLRSKPGTALGAWLSRRGARPGDAILAGRFPPGRPPVIAGHPVTWALTLIPRPAGEGRTGRGGGGAPRARKGAAP